MRLLHLHPAENGRFATAELQPPTQRPPRYAILSHTWGGSEVLFDNVQAINSPVHLELSGVLKCRRACELAYSEGIQYLWIDTACIDKKNSTELSEAINSMYRYYAESEVCYAYLFDVPDNDDITHQNSNFRNSRWFKRGWTLQELLAPKEVRFYSKGWKLLGTKADLKDLIHSITRIPEDVLAGSDCQPPARSLAEVLSWASRRQTSVVEDGAYSLLGLLDINMPLLYGEGPKALIRLQEELLRRHDDESLFAWESPAEDAVAKPCHGLLSPSLTYFQASHRFRHPTIRTRANNGSARNLASNGISLKLPRIDIDKDHGLYYALLDCQVNSTYTQPAIQVQHLSGNHYARVDVHHIHEVGFDQLMRKDGFLANCLMVFPSKPQAPKPVVGFITRQQWPLGCLMGVPEREKPYGGIRVVDRQPSGRWSNVLGSSSSHIAMEFTANELARTSAANSTLVRPLGILILEIFEDDNGTITVDGKAKVVLGLDIVRGSYPGAIDRVKPWGFLVPLSRAPIPTRLPAERPGDLIMEVGEGRNWECHLRVLVKEKDFPGRVLYEIQLVALVISKRPRSPSIINTPEVIRRFFLGSPSR